MDDPKTPPLTPDLPGLMTTEAENAARHVAALRDQIEDLSTLGSVAAALRDAATTPADSARKIADQLDHLAITAPSIDALAPLVSDLMALCQTLRERVENRK